MRFKIGIYGVIVNFFLIIFNFSLYIFGIYGSTDFSLLLVEGSLFLLSSFIVYFFLIPLYLRKREKIERHVIVIDVLIGILSEFLILIVACTIYSLFGVIQGMIMGLKGIISGFMSGVLILPLYFLAPLGYLSLSYQFIFFGVVSGMISWYTLKNTSPYR
jgi:hypothetical protein